jgi:hypothetical protein
VKERRAEIPAVLALWRETDAVRSFSDDPASLRRLLDASEDALLVAEAEHRLTAQGRRPRGEPGPCAAVARSVVRPAAGP